MAAAPNNAPLFGAVVPGRPMLYFQQVNAKKFLLSMPAAVDIKEVLFVALRPQAIPAHHGLTIYFTLSNDEKRQWEYLGSLLPQLPSILVRAPWFDLQSPNVQVQFGLSLETQEFIQNVDEDAGNEGLVRDLAMAIGKNLYTFMCSFAQRSGDVLVIPTSCIDKWWTKFREKHQRLPYFFMRKQ